MASSHGDGSDEMLEAQAHVWNQIFQFINSMSLNCAVQLGIPDAIHRHGLEPMPLSQLAAALPINPAKAQHLGRLMRLLVHSGFFATQKIDATGREGYVLTPSSRLLLTGTATTMSPFLLTMLDPVLVKPFQCLGNWFMGSDSSAFQTANGVNFWEQATHNSELSSKLHHGLASDARLTMSAVVKDHGLLFQGLRSLIDVGGGTGIAAETIANAFPHLKCSVLDLPRVVASAPKRNNVSMIGGDMFESIPSADAVFLKRVLHDWSDDECVRILKKCKEAIPPGVKGGKVIILEVVVNKNINGDHKALETQLFFDLMILSCVPTGKERDENEWRKIFIDAGFTDYMITSMLGPQSIIEVYP
ncbi:hypothetical protein ACLOJK_009749 [Asimina triloba]